jgi:hypothetical protein
VTTAPLFMRPVPRPNRMRASLLPMQIVMAYQVVVFLLFLFWPINWPIYTTGQWVGLIAYVAVCFSAIAVFFSTGATGQTTASKPVPARALIHLGGILAIVLLVPLTIAYTGQGPWNVFQALQQQGDAYRQFQDQLILTSGERGPVALLRAITWPVVFAVIPLGIIYWTRIGYVTRALVVATFLCSLIFSIMRGTDREIAENFIVIAAAFLITLGRTPSLRNSLYVYLKRYWRPAAVLGLLLIVGASLFTERKTERLGRIETVCANVSTICADLDAPAIAWLDDRAKFSTSIFILSVSSGYYGLALGLEKPFYSTLGAGHSAFALSIQELVSGNASFKDRTYVYRNTFDGWPPENYWSTAILWFANDVGFPGAVIVMALAGFLWGRSWRDATTGGNDGAAIVFCLVMVGMVQLTSNNAVLNALEGYLALIGWSVVWISTRHAGSRMAADRRGTMPVAAWRP